jgi:hypothetical protein
VVVPFYLVLIVKDSHPSRERTGRVAMFAFMAWESCPVQAIIHEVTERNREGGGERERERVRTVCG